MGRLRFIRVDDEKFRNYGRIICFAGFFGGFWGQGEGKDVVEWGFNREDGFSVASFYDLYASLQTPFGPSCRCDEGEGLVWKSEVSFKIKAFGWRILSNKLSTKYLLVYKGISIPFDSLKCSFNGIDSENRDHSFFVSLLIKNIWREIAF